MIGICIHTDHAVTIKSFLSSFVFLYSLFFLFYGVGVGWGTQLINHLSLKFEFQIISILIFCTVCNFYNEMKDDDTGHDNSFKIVRTYSVFNDDIKRSTYF